MQEIRLHILWLFAALLLVAVATFVRIAPLIEGGDRLQRQCVSEDGYLMLTIARNSALGRGFSISDGQIPTNGTQPLSALIYALCFALVGADRFAGLYPVVAWQFLVSVGTAALLYLATRRWFYRGPHAHWVALLAAVLWYASPTSLMHTQNSLETGLYVLLILASLACYDAFRPRLRESLSLGRCVLLGLLLGLAFLARNDACFLIAVLLLIHLVRTRRRRVGRRALAQAVVIGLCSLTVATPWLWFNLSRFGHIVPVSGRAESLGVPVGQNFLPAFAAMLENVLLVLRIPSALQDRTIVQVSSAGCLLALAGVAIWRRRWLAERFSPGVGVLACFSGALFIYYGVFFGMPSFLGRYFFPAVMFSALVAAAVTVSIVQQVRWPGDMRAAAKPKPGRIAGRRGLVAAVGLAAVAACLGLDLRIYRKGTEHLHFQVVDWVRDNVPPDAWVAAVQTGTLGYYHDRTINLDGKVDPHAFAARRQNRIPDYVVERNVEYIADWVGIASWADVPAFAANYELIEKDVPRNLAVLKRRSPASPRAALDNRRPGEVNPLELSKSATGAGSERQIP